MSNIHYYGNDSVDYDGDNCYKLTIKPLLVHDDDDDDNDDDDDDDDDDGKKCWRKRKGRMSGGGHALAFSSIHRRYHLHKCTEGPHPGWKPMLFSQVSFIA